MEGRIIEGIQERVVSKELFLKVNGILSQNHQGHSLKPENEEVPLKRFLKCDDCGSYLRAYKAYKNQQYYYKCNTPGCKCNKRADSLHREFKTLLNNYSLDINEDYRIVIREQMIAIYNQVTAEGKQQRELLQKQLAEVDKKLHRLKERFALEEIDREMYEEFKPRFLDERKAIEKELTGFPQEVSNLEKCINDCITYASKVSALWDLGNYGERQQLQFLVFPKGILYNRKNDQCRTPRVNEIFRQIAVQASDLHQIKNGKKTFYSYIPVSVV